MVKEVTQDSCTIDLMNNPVECYSGYEYPEYPVAFIWNGERVEISAIISQWKSENRKTFRVNTHDGSLFELSYIYSIDTWQTVELIN